MKNIEKMLTHFSWRNLPKVDFFWPHVVFNLTMEWNPPPLVSYKWGKVEVNLLNGKNRTLITDEPVEFEKYLVQEQDFRKLTNHLGGIYGIYLKWMKKTQKITKYNWLDL